MLFPARGAQCFLGSMSNGCLEVRGCDSRAAAGEVLAQGTRRACGAALLPAPTAAAGRAPKKLAVLHAPQASVSHAHAAAPGCFPMPKLYAVKSKAPCMASPPQGGVLFPFLMPGLALAGCFQ